MSYSVQVREIADAPLCAEMGSEDIALFARHLNSTSHKQGDVLYREGSTDNDDLLILLEGNIEVSTEQRFELGTTLRIQLDPGDVAGILGFVGGKPHVGTAKALSDCRVARLPRQQFAHLCEKHGNIAISVLKFLVLALDRFSSGLVERYKDSLSFMYGAMNTKK